MVLWYGRSCEEMCGAILWVSKQDDLNNLLHASMIIILRKKEWNLLENCHKYALKLFWNDYIWQRIGRLDIRWSVNKLAQSITKWTESLWQNDWIVCILHPSHMWIQTELLCGKYSTTMQAWDCFKTPILQETWKTQNPLLEEHYVFSESHTFVPISWMCKKQPSVSHSSTESEIISLDAGLRLDGISRSRFVGSDCFSPWKIIQTHDRTGTTRCEWTVTEITGTSSDPPGMINVLNNIDCVPSNVQFSHQEALLYVFEDKRSSD